MAHSSEVERTGCRTPGNSALLQPYLKTAAVSLLSVAVLLCSYAVPAHAIVNCFDYVKSRLTDQDVNPPPPGDSHSIDRFEIFSCKGQTQQRVIINNPVNAKSGMFTSYDGIRNVVKSKNYSIKKWKRGEPLPRLSHKDVILIGAHGGFVNSAGRIDHYLQIPTAMSAHFSSDEVRKLRYPLCKEVSSSTTVVVPGLDWPYVWEGTACLCGGLSVNDTLDQFADKTRADELEIWCQPRRIQIVNRTPAGGDVPVSPISAAYAEEVRLTFKPKSGYEADGSPSGCGIKRVSGDDYVTAPVTDDCTVELGFRKRKYIVSGVAKPPEAGSIDPSNYSVEYENRYRFGITAKEGWRVKDSDNGCGGILTRGDGKAGSFVTGAVTNECSFEVYFRKVHTIKVDNRNPDIGEIHIRPDEEVEDGGDAEIIASVKKEKDGKGYEIKFTSDCPGSADAGKFHIRNLNRNCRVTVSFEKKRLQVVPVVRGPGTMDPSSPQSVLFGETTSFYVIPDSGNHITDISSDKTGAGCNEGIFFGKTYKTDAVKDNCSVITAFAKNIKISLNTSIPVKQIKAGQDITVQAKPERNVCNQGYDCVWYVNDRITGPKGGAPLKLKVAGGKTVVSFVITKQVRNEWQKAGEAVIEIEPSEKQETELKRTISGQGTLVAPGHGKQQYSVHTIDASEFTEGGTISISISVGQRKSSASFDLFPANVAIPTVGRPAGTLAGSYDISPGSRTGLTHKFKKGQVFRFGATGNWFSEKGATNTYAFTAEITGVSHMTPGK